MPPVSLLRQQLAEADARAELAEEEYRQLASRMVFLRMFMFVMVISALTNRRHQPLHHRPGKADGPGATGAPLRGVWMPRYCERRERRWVAPVPVIYSSRHGWDRQHHQLVESAGKALEQGKGSEHPVDVLR